MSNIEQTVCSRTHYSDFCLSKTLEHMHEPGQRRGEKMEEHRCKTVAIAIEDSRCAGSLNSGLVEAEDPRCMSLQSRVVMEIEDRRCNSVSIGMEDPRCQSLQMKW